MIFRFWYHIIIVKNSDLYNPGKVFAEILTAATAILGWTPSSAGDGKIPGKEA